MLKYYYGYLIKKWKYKYFFIELNNISININKLHYIVF